MIYLLLCIVFNSFLFVVFKFSEKYKVNPFPFLSINYVVAGAIGVIHHYSYFHNRLTAPQLITALIAGFVFIVVFNQMRLTTQVNGLAVASIASKMSMLIPILGSYFLFQEDISLLQGLGILIGLVAVYIISVSKKSVEILNKAPIYLFIGAGYIDLFLKISQDNLLQGVYAPLFVSTIFFSAAFFGFAYSFKRNSVSTVVSKVNLMWGVILGLVNYASLLFILKSIAHPDIKGVVFFPVNNIGIVAISTLLGYLIFKQKVDKRKAIGLALAICSILLIL